MQHLFILGIIFTVTCLMALMINFLLLTKRYGSRPVGKPNPNTPNNAQAAAGVTPQETPRVAILVAARNEEARLGKCLDSLLAQDYPADKLEIWVGNDASEDGTLALVEGYATRHPHIHALDITARVGNRMGKANVLAQLAAKAQGQVFMITDADIVVPTQWVSRMVAALGPGVGIVSGVTGVQRQGPVSPLLSHMQHLEWLYYFTLFRFLDANDDPMYSMGNNMLVTRQAYEATGGYARLPHTLKMEDLQLFQAVMKRGFKHVQAFEPAVLNLSEPQPNNLAVLRQYKRWRVDTRGGSFMQQMLFIVTMLFYPFILLYLGISITTQGLWPGAMVPLVFWVAKLGLQSAVLHRTLRTLGSKASWHHMLLYEGYALVLNTVGLFAAYMIRPRRFKWKGREYKK